MSDDPTAGGDAPTKGRIDDTVNLRAFGRERRYDRDPQTDQRLRRLVEISRPTHNPEIDSDIELLALDKLPAEYHEHVPKFFKVAKRPARFYGFDDKRRSNTFEVAKRRDAVAVLPIDRETGEVILVQQFRSPTARKGDLQGWLVETVAGMIKEDDDRLESYVDCALRETFEETGLKLVPETLQCVGWFWPSPGGSDERIVVFIGDIDRSADGAPAAKAAQDGAVRGVGDEYVVLRRIPISDFRELVAKGEFSDSKIIAAEAALRREDQRAREVARNEHPRDYVLSVGGREAAIGDRKVTIGVQPGDIAEVHDADVWVNSEDPSMEMDRWIARSISATIRKRGAVTSAEPKTGADNDDATETDIYQDSVFLALRAAVGSADVAIGDAFETPPGALRRRNNVKRLVHVCAVGKNQRGKITDIEECTRKALEKIEAGNPLFEAPERLRRYLPLPWRETAKSALLPLFGAGNGKLRPAEVAREMVEAITAYFEANRTSKLERVRVLGYTKGDVEQIEQALRAAGLVRAEPPAAEPQDEPAAAPSVLGETRQ